MHLHNWTTKPRPPQDVLAYLRARVLPRYAKPSEAAPTSEQLEQARRFRVKLDKMCDDCLHNETFGFYRETGVTGAYHTLRAVRARLREIRHTKLRAAYSQVVYETETEFNRWVQQLRREQAQPPRSRQV